MPNVLKNPVFTLIYFKPDPSPGKKGKKEKNKKNNIN